MANIRPEVFAFVLAAQALMSLDAQANPFPLSDYEIEEIVNYMVRLEQRLLDANVSSSDGDVLRSNGEGHRDGDGHR